MQMGKKGTHVLRKVHNQLIKGGGVTKIEHSPQRQDVEGKLTLYEVCEQR